MEKKEIDNLEDIKLLVDSFYSKVRDDERLGPIFEERIGGKWEPHLEKMYRFWQSILLGEHTYSGAPFLPHATMPIGEEHFNQWVKLFTETVDSHFTGEKAEEAKWRAGHMAKLFQSKKDYLDRSGQTPLK